MIDHTGHPHPSTPAARALCRANGGTGSIAKSKKESESKKRTPALTEARVPVPQKKSSSSDEPVSQKPKTGEKAHEIVPKGLFKEGTMTPEQQKALKTYETGWFMVLQSYLRGITDLNDIDRRDLETIKQIDSAMEDSRLPEPIVAYRGMFNARTVFGDNLDSNLTGFAWEDKGYGSVTTDEKITEKFTSVNGQTVPDSVHMVVRVAKGVKVLQTSTHTQGSRANGPQAEITLGRGLRWKVVKDNGFKGDRRFIEVEVDSTR